MDLPSGETVLERKVHDRSCGMKVVTTTSLVSLRTVMVRALPRLSATTARPKRASSTPAVGDGVAVAAPLAVVADGVAPAVVGDDGALATG